LVPVPESRPPGETIMCVPGDSGCVVVMAVLSLTRLAEKGLDVSGEL
jgi:hypothetical protein